MNLFPIHIVVSEGALHINKIFFVEQNRFSAVYFLSNIVAQIPALMKKEEAAQASGESIVHRIYMNTDLQIKRFSSDIASFLLHFPNRKIYTSVDFKVENCLRIEDKVVFTLPLGRVPEIYAEDLFKTYGIPEEELLLLFVFYLREEIYTQIHKCLADKLCKEDTASVESFQSTSPEISVGIDLKKLSGVPFIYESHGKVAIAKEHDRKGEGKPRRKNSKHTTP
ncbi:hypothetical protein NECID01_1391 [Nematocida sp. AWRm77]|nr:hypothetical protein NECID01_1391 [Nematocida sp. AWRm77]